MEDKLAEKEGSELDRAIERLDHFKSIQQRAQHHGDALSPGASRRGSTEVLTKASARHPVAGAELCFDRLWPFASASPVFPIPADRYGAFMRQTDRRAVCRRMVMTSAGDRFRLAMVIEAAVTTSHQKGGQAFRSRSIARIPRIAARPSVDLAPERHHEIGDAVEPFPAPCIEFRRLAVARRQRIDFVVASGEAQREPFLALAAEFRQPMRRRPVVGAEIRKSASRSRRDSRH